MPDSLKPIALGPEPPYDLTDPRVIRRVEQTYHMHARKSFSQHWLTDRDALDTLIKTAELSPSSNVLEVGAGMGVLTAELARRAGRVISVEIEKDVFPILQDMTNHYDNVSLLQSDLLTVIPGQLFGISPYTFVANLPYAITAFAIRHFLETTHPPTRMVILIQKEVAERIAASPGEMSVLALSVQFFSTPKIVSLVPARCFMPPPKVDSAIISLDIHPPLLEEPLRSRMFSLAKMCFSQRRKQLHNSLPGSVHLPADEVNAWLESVNIDGERRPQTLSLAEWVALAEADPRPLPLKIKPKKLVSK